MAYAAVSSFMQTLEQLLHPNPFFNFQNREDIMPIYENLVFFIDFLENSENLCNDHEIVKCLENQMREATCTGENFIDLAIFNFHVPDSRRLRKKAYGNTPRSLAEVIESIDSVKAGLMKIYDQKNIIRIQNTGIFRPQGTSRDILNSNDVVVGLDNDVMEIRDQLTGPSPQLEIISILGMGGIGKTTLAKRVFNDPVIVYHFHIRAWITISQSYNLRELLLGLLGSISELSDKIYSKNDEQLCEHLFRSLKGRRYIVVMDDMWCTKAWDVLERSFPSDDNGSRIILTSRLTEVASLTKSHTHHLGFLSADTSWELLREMVFPNERCPPYLLNLGKKIAMKCQGLPLAVLVIAGLVSKIERSPYSWQDVAENVSRFVTNDPKKCLDVLALSYNHLPHYLKSCFLYMAAFPVNFRVQSRRLIRLWIAEGFIKPTSVNSMEDVAEEYLGDLIDRSLILVEERSSNGKVKTCYVHDLVWDLCLREAKKENFLHVIKMCNQSFPVRGKESPHRLILHFESSDGKNDFGIQSQIEDYVHSNASLPFTRSFLCFSVSEILASRSSLESLLKLIGFKLVRVVDMTFLHFNHFPVEIIQLIHLRYLGLATGCDLPASICKLLGLQSLLIHCYWGGSTLPQEIWKLSHLRHLSLRAGTYFPSITGAEIDAIPNLENLQTLSAINLTCYTNEVLARLPNLRKLGIRETEENNLNGECLSDSLSSLASLHNLQSLKFLLRGRKEIPRKIPHWSVFPSKLNKLTLSGCHLPWTDISILGKLPNLEVLKLKNYAFQGPEWESSEGEFGHLKYLLIELTDIVHWRDTCIIFPRLQQLVIISCRHLMEIPYSFWEIPTLLVIELDDSSASAVSSARRIQEEQHSYGNDGLVVRIRHSSDE